MMSLSSISSRRRWHATGRHASWTINGIHLNEYGDTVVASIIDATPVRRTAGVVYRPAHGELRRRPVLERNFYWFNRYRTVDGYSIFGGRADLRFKEYDPKTGKKTGKINTNREVAQREMEILDEMTANRDKLVWAAAQGKAYKVDDTNTEAVHRNLARTSRARCRASSISSSAARKRSAR